MARPTKYKVEFCDTVLELFKQGKSIAQICLRLDIAKDTFYHWKEKHEAFSDSVKMGEFFSQGWWEDQGQDGLWINGAEGADKLNSTVWFMNMKNRFSKNWKDKHEDEEQQAKSIPDLNINVCLNKDQINGGDN